MDEGILIKKVVPINVWSSENRHFDKYSFLNHSYLAISACKFKIRFLAADNLVKSRRISFPLQRTRCFCTNILQRERNRSSPSVRCAIKISRGSRCRMVFTWTPWNNRLAGAYCCSFCAPVITRFKAGNFFVQKRVPLLPVGLYSYDSLINAWIMSQIHRGFNNSDFSS